MFQNLIKNIVIVAFLFAGILLTPAAPSWADDETDLFSVAQKAFDDGFYDVGIRYITQFLEQYPQSQKLTQAKLLLGQCYFFQNQYLKAYEIFQPLLGYEEFKDATLFWLGETYLKGADYPQAEKHYQQLIELYKDSVYRPQAYYSLGWTYFEQGNFEAAKDTFWQIVNKFPTHQLREDALFKYAESLYNLGKYEDALASFEKYVDQYPQSTRIPQVHFYMGESYYYLSNFLNASTFYAKASDMSLDPKTTLMAKISQGWCYLKLERYDLSEKAFDDALMLSRNNDMKDDIYLGKATLYTDMEQREKAIEYYSKLLDEFPQSPRLPEAYFGKANNLYLSKNYPEAADTYLRLIKDFSGKAELAAIVEKAYFGLAWTYLKNNQTDQAIEQFQTLINTSGSMITKVSALTQLGDAYQEIDKFDEAFEVYDKVLKEHPESPYTDYAQYRQGIALLKQDKLESATLSFKTLSANFPKSKYIVDAKYFLGVAYYKKEDWASASDYLEEYLKIKADSEFIAEANYILALCYLNLKETKKALKTFQDILTNFPAEQNIIKSAEMGIAKSLYASDQQEQGIEKFKQITEKYPDSSVAQDALLWLGNHYVERENFEEAIKHYEEILRRFPSSTQTNFVNYVIAQSYEQLEQYDKAIEHYKRIPDSSDQEIYIKARLSIADIFSKQTDPQKAIQTYENIIAHSPEFKRDALMKLAELHKAQPDYPKALEVYQQALAAPAGLSVIPNAEIQFSIADTYELLRDPAKAIEEYFKIPYLYPNNPSWEVKAYLRAAKLFEDAEKWEDAKTAYNKIIAYKTEEAVYAKERLETLNAGPAAVGHP